MTTESNTNLDLSAGSAAATMLTRKG